MNKKKFKVVVRGGYGLTNFGDDALLKSLHEDYFSNFTTSELAYSCTHADYLNKYIPGFTVLSLEENYADLCDVLVYGGGTQFYSFEKNNIKEKILNNIQLLKKPITLIGKIFMVFRRGHLKKRVYESDLKTMAVGIGVGPFLPKANPRTEENVKYLFKNMEVVCVRDVYSNNKCKEWGVENYNLYADLCFKMSHPLFFKQNTNKSIRNIGIIVRDWERTKEGGSYREALMKFADRVRKDNTNVHFFVFAKDSDMGWINFFNQNGHKFNLWNPELTEFGDYLQKLYMMDFFVTARYHGAIFASMLGKPFITIVVEQKLKMVSELFLKGSKNWAYPYDSGDLYKKYSEINENYENHCLSITTIALEQRKLAFQMFEDLQKKLKSIK